MSQSGSDRASDADRERAVSRLITAYAEGRIDLTEIEERVSVADEARTQAELAVTLQALPAPRNTEAVTDPVGA